MQELHLLEIDSVSGGYLRLDVNVTAFDVFSIRNDNKFKGGILHTSPSAPMRKEKTFPSALTMLDY